ncbi:MAG: thiol reductase thioredoxin [Anaerolineaceae bacterium]|nr:thiol reductase thioredoxin [Anaerolineaceae bacterium]
MLTEFHKRTFNAEVLASEKPVLVYFTGVNCQPCKMVTPVVEQLASEWDGRVKIGKIDINRNMFTALKYGVMKAPTLLLFINGEEVARIMGVNPKNAVISQLQPHLG